MDIQEFKQHIENNDLNISLDICKYKGNGDFIFHQYLKEYITRNNYNVDVISDITPSKSKNIFDVSCNTVKVCNIDKLENLDIDPTKNHDMIWVKCKSIDKKIQKRYSDNIIELPALESWQIKDYILSITDLSNKYAEELYNAYKDNMYALDNELSKLILFDSQEKIYTKVKDQLYNDISEYNMFDIVNAIIKRDIVKVQNIISQKPISKDDTYGFLSLLITNFKKVIDIQLNPKATAESLKISAKQFYAIKKYSCGYYTKQQLINIYKFLTNCDYMIKSGYADIGMMADFIIAKIFTF